MGLKTIAGTGGGGGGGGAFGPQDLLLDPRNYGAKATGFYGIDPTTLTVTTAGTGFAVGDTFIVADQTITGRVRGNTNAIGHVTSVDGSGAVTGLVLDTVGSGYYAGHAIFLQPLTGVGVGCKVTFTGVYTPPSAPTLTLASGGNATGSGSANNYYDGSQYVVGDIFAVPNSLNNNNYITARVSAVTSGRVTAWAINNPGGDYAPATNVAAITLTGYGHGLTFNVTSTTVANNTFDDTYGYMVASAAAIKVGGSVLVIDNSYVAALMPPSGTMLVGQQWTPNWEYCNINPINPSSNPHLFIIGAPNFGIDCNGQSLGFANFTISGVDNGAFGSTAAIGSLNGMGGFINGRCDFFNMSFKNCYCGIGSVSGGGDLMFVITENCDFGANQYGVNGPLSDWVSTGDEFIAGTAGIVLTSASQFARIVSARFEYLTFGINVSGNSGGGGGQLTMVGCQFDRLVNYAIECNTDDIVNITGGAMRGCGFAGTLTVTGTANNGSGLIRLTVSGFGNNANGGATPTSGLVTGDKGNVIGVGGTIEANGNQWTITVVDGTHIDLQGSAYVNAYTSGGFAGINGKSSPIVLNTSTDFHSANVDYIGDSAGSEIASAFIVDATGSNRISFTGGTANNNNGPQGSYRMTFGNWHNSTNTPPTDTYINVNGNQFYNTTGQLENLIVVSGTTYTLPNTISSSAIVEFTGSSATAVSATAAAGYQIGASFILKNAGTGTVTYTASSGAGETIDGLATLVVAPNTSVKVYTDQANWHSSEYGNALEIITYPFNFQTVGNGTFPLDPSANFNYTILGVSTIGVASGTVTASLQVTSIPLTAGTTVTGLGSLAVTSTPSPYNATGANQVVVGQCMQLVLSSNSSALNFFVSIKIMRTS